MENNDENLIRTLRDRIASLEIKVLALTDKHRRDVTALIGRDDIFYDYRKMLSAQIADLQDRITKLELLAYPNLVRDMDHLHEVIGDRPTISCNPLDFRTIKKSS